MKASCNKESQATLRSAVDVGDMDTCRLLLERGTFTDGMDEYGWTPLHEAAEYGRADICRLLLEHGANPGIRNKKGELPEDLTSDSALIALLQGCRKA